MALYKTFNFGPQRLRFKNVGAYQQHNPVWERRIEPLGIFVLRVGASHSASMFIVRGQTAGLTNRAIIVSTAHHATEQRALDALYLKALPVFRAFGALLNYDVED